MSENEMEIIQPFIQENVEISNILKDEFESKLEFIQFVTSLPYCLAPWLSSHVNFKGDRRPCEFYEEEGLSYACTFEDYWNSSYLKNIRINMLINKPPTGCQTCIKSINGKKKRLVYHYLLFHMKQNNKIKWDIYNTLDPVSLDYRFLDDDKIKDEFLNLLNSGNVSHINFEDNYFYESALSRKIIDNLIVKGFARDIILRLSNSKLSTEIEGENIPLFLKQNFKKVTLSINLNEVFDKYGIVSEDESWKKWLEGYYEYKKILGNEMLSFNLKVTIPILMELKRIANFLTEEKISYILDTYYMFEEEWLMSPLSLGYDNLSHLFRKLNLQNENSQIQLFAEETLAKSKKIELIEIKKNYTSAMIYYSQYNLNLKSKQHLKYLYTNIELKHWWYSVSSMLYENRNKEYSSDAWWQSVQPNYLVRYNKKKLFRNVLTKIPQELGRNIYKIVLCAQVVYIKLTNDFKFEAWARNSLSEDYFEFFSSDLDLSVEIKSDENIFFYVDKLKKNFKINPLIKEINFYFPYSINLIRDFYNYYELCRDKVLLQKLTGNFAHNSSTAHKIVFLIRKIQANLKLFKNEFNHRDTLKWKHYLALCECQIDINRSCNGLNVTQLLSSILNYYNLQDEINYIQLEQLIYYVSQKVPASILYKEMKLESKLIAFFPQYFCTLNITLGEVSPILEEVFIGQIEWELTSILTQLNLNSEDSNLRRHFLNLKNLILNSIFITSIAQDRKSRILRFFENLEIFLKSNKGWD